MEPPMKRPRLSMFREIDSNDTLSMARDRNDIRLKSRFESIFEKYSRNFDDVADEVDLMTGEILVNRGHLASMQNEKDAGLLQSKMTASAAFDDSRRDGKRLLRAMTVAPEDEDYNLPRPSIEGEGGTEEDDSDDDVLLLFERIAENAANKTSFTDVQIKEEKEEGESHDQTADEDGYEPENVDEVDNSDRDSLLGYSAPPIRSESPDSLLDGDEIRDRDFRERSDTPDSLLDQDNHSSRASSKRADGEQSDTLQTNDADAIMRQYGPEVGPHILEFLRSQEAMKEAKFDPAWRLPEGGPLFADRPSISQPNQDGNLDDEEPIPADGMPSPIQGSLWAPGPVPERRMRFAFPPPRTKPRTPSMGSDGSVDPLQEDFRRYQKEKLSGPDLDEWQAYVEENVCPYCKQYKLHLTQHFRLIVDKGEDGLHDVEYLTEFVKSRQMGVGDLKIFLEIVQYKEVDDLDFKDIATKTDQTVKYVYNTYYQYRTTQKTEEELAAEGRPWTQDEDDRLLEIAKDPDATVRSAKNAVRKRKYGEIANRLATLHMRGLGQPGAPAVAPIRRRYKMQNSAPPPPLKDDASTPQETFEQHSAYQAEPDNFEPANDSGNDVLRPDQVKQDPGADDSDDSLLGK